MTIISPPITALLVRYFSSTRFFGPGHIFNVWSSSSSLSFVPPRLVGPSFTHADAPKRKKLRTGRRSRAPAEQRANPRRAFPFGFTNILRMAFHMITDKEERESARAHTTRTGDARRTHKSFCCCCCSARAHRMSAAGAGHHAVLTATGLTLTKTTSSTTKKPAFEIAQSARQVGRGRGGRRRRRRRRKNLRRRHQVPLNSKSLSFSV
jgi:hypothetical protein